MTEKERLIRIIFRKLALVETESNQSVIREIEGLLYAIRHLED